MKHKPLIITFFAVSALSLGCKPSAEQERQDTAQQLDKLKMETKEAAQETENYTFAQKSVFVEKMKAQIAEINRDLDQLTARIATSSEAAQLEAKPKLQAQREQVSKLNLQLEEAKNATESTWTDVKAGFKKGYGELKDGVHTARQWVSDKIAP